MKSQKYTPGDLFVDASSNARIALCFTSEFHVIACSANFPEIMVLREEWLQRGFLRLTAAKDASRE